MQTEPNTAHAQAHKLRQVIAGLNTEIAAAERAIVNAEGEAKRIALHVVLGKASQNDQEQHRRDVAQAREAVGDKQAVRDAARDELRRLEAAETAEKRAAAAVVARKLVAERIEAARRIDEAAKAMQAAFADFERLGDDIPATGAELRLSPTNMAQYENIRGHRRIDGVLPALLDVLHPNLIRAARIPSLASSEEALWRALLGE